MAIGVSDLMNTIDHNINAKKDDLYFQRILQERHLPTCHVPLVKTFIRERSQILSDEVVSFISALSTQESKNSEKQTIDRIGLGIYYYQDEEKENTKRS